MNDRQIVATLIAVSLFGGIGHTMAATTPEEVRSAVLSRIASINDLQVPATDADLPQPTDSRFQITPEKKRLGKLLFFDPIRNNNVHPEFGGKRLLAQSSSCGSCHVGLAASKAGQQTAFGQGAEGFGYIDDVTGLFVGDRKPYADLTDVVPTQFEMSDAAGTIVASGRFDAVDSVPRLSPTIIGLAFNQRLLWDGAAGEPYDGNDPTKANANPGNLPAAENLVQRANRAHRMLETQRFAIQEVPAYMRLFKEAFPEDFAAYEASKNPDDLCNDDLIQRAMAAFLRSVVTRNTPYDKFLAGDDTALTDSQLRGAWLFFTPATEGGANCVACHSGPMLNKVLGDEDGTLVEENFHNVGIGDHPLQDLMRDVLNNDGHRDRGRADVTADAGAAFKFKTPTLRQARDAAPYMHDGGFATLRQVLDYFNAGEPKSEDAANAGTVDALFTHPRGDSETGLGLSDADLDALEDFLANGLYDAAFVNFDPDSTTDTFELNERDLNYSFEMQMLGAVNGKVPSGLFHPQTDARSITEISLINDSSQTGVCGGFDVLSMLFAVPLMFTAARIRRRRLN